MPSTQEWGDPDYQKMYLQRTYRTLVWLSHFGLGKIEDYISGLPR